MPKWFFQNISHKFWKPFFKKSNQKPVFQIFVIFFQNICISYFSELIFISINDEIMYYLFRFVFRHLKNLAWPRHVPLGASAEISLVDAEWGLHQFPHLPHVGPIKSPSPIHVHDFLFYWVQSDLDHLFGWKRCAESCVNYWSPT